jgi:alpha-glucan,water dikinase
VEVVTSERRVDYHNHTCYDVDAQVGNYPGRALAFSIPPGSNQPEFLALPSKRVGLFAPHGGTLIARSDTNGEDLEAFAGAGLYDR